MAEKRCLAPGSAKNIDQSSPNPKTLFHFLMLLRFWVIGMLMLARISASRSEQCNDRCTVTTVIDTMSTIHPKTFFILPRRHYTSFPTNGLASPQAQAVFVQPLGYCYRNK